MKNHVYSILAKYKERRVQSVLKSVDLISSYIMLVCRFLNSRCTAYVCVMALLPIPLATHTIHISLFLLDF